MPDSLTITRPDDFHLHLRDGAILEAVVGASSHFARATVMPNLVPPVATADAVAAYAARIREAMPEGMAFEPLMTLYLTDETTPRIIDEAAPHVIAAKLYPAHATTNSAAGVSNVEGLTPVLERMAERGMLLLVHGEVSDPAVDIFDREAVFLENVLDPLRRRVPSLRVVLEHMSTARAVEYVADGGENLGGTITAHHLVIDRNDLLAGGIRPHNYCLPIVKRARDRKALCAAATRGSPRIFFGSDSAPHTDHRKLGPCGAAGCFTAPVALAILAGVFEEAGALDRLERFVAKEGAAFYGLPENGGTLTLERCEPMTSAPIETPDGPIAVFDPGRPIAWRVRE